MTEEKKRLTLRRPIEEVILLGEELTIENVDINGTEYKLKIINQRGRLVFDFNNRDYEIIVDEEGIRFERCAYRPNHDHNDFESLQEGIDESLIGVKKGELKWRTRFPYSKKGYRHFHVPFGSRTVEW